MHDEKKFSSSFSLRKKLERLRNFGQFYRTPRLDIEIIQNYPDLEIGGIKIYNFSICVASIGGFKRFVAYIALAEWKELFLNNVKIRWKEKCIIIELEMCDSSFQRILSPYPSAR